MRKLSSGRLKWLASSVILVASAFLFSSCAPANQPPAISSLSVDEKSVTPSGSSQVVCIASDPDGDNLGYTWSANGGNISGDGPVVNWAAPDTAGAYTITAIVTDGRGDKAIAQLTINLLSINHPPVIQSLAAEPPEVTQAESTLIKCVASDPDGNELSYSWSTTWGDLSGQGSSVTWVAPEVCGDYTVRVTVTDGKGGEASDELEITVKKPG